MEGKNVSLREIVNFAELEKLFKNYSLTSGLDVALFDLSGEEQLAVRRVQRRGACAAQPP